MNKKDLSQFQEIVSQLLQAEKDEPVVKPIAAEKLFDQLDLSLEKAPLDDESFYQSLKEIVFKTPRTASNKFFNQLFGGRRSKSVLGDLVAVMLNNSMYTYKVAGPMVGVEKVIIKKVCNMIGYGEMADGTIATGGSMSNFTAMVMARDAANANLTTAGVEQKMIVYTSADSHYSIAKNTALIGVGRDQVRFIKTDEYGKMISEELEKQIIKDKTEGLLPFFVNATAGTTVMGAFDDIKAASAISKKHNLWLHVDGAYCGAVIFSEKYKFLVDGLELSDSFSVNAHKMLGTPLTCSIIVCQNKEHLNHSFSNDATYLYQTDGDDYNLGKTSFQCGRRNDALKLWTLWKSVGSDGLEKMVDHQFKLADIAREYIQNNSDYTLYSYGDSVSVCFNYKGIPAPKLCTALYQNAELVVGFGSFNDHEFVRFVTINPDNNKEEIIAFFNTLEAFANKHFEELMEVETTNS